MRLAALSQLSYGNVYKTSAVTGTQVGHGPDHPVLCDIPGTANTMSTPLRSVPTVIPLIHNDVDGSKLVLKCGEASLASPQALEKANLGLCPSISAMHSGILFSLDEVLVGTCKLTNEGVGDNGHPILFGVEELTITEHVSKDLSSIQLED